MRMHGRNLVEDIQQPQLEHLTYIEHLRYQAERTSLSRCVAIQGLSASHIAWIESSSGPLGSISSSEHWLGLDNAYTPIKLPASGLQKRIASYYGIQDIDQAECQNIVV